MPLSLPDFALILIDAATPEAAARLAGAFPSNERVPAPDAPTRVAQNLAARVSSVVDIRSMDADARRALRDLAREHYCQTWVLAVARSRGASDERVIQTLENQGFSRILRVDESELGGLVITRTPLACDRRGDAGPFDLIGDVHGCCDEVDLLLERLGYRHVAVRAGNPADARGGVFEHPAGRRALFLGDYCDRGPRIVDAFRAVMAMSAHGSAVCLTGNHDHKLAQLLAGRKTRVTKGVAASVEALDALGDGAAEMRRRIVEFVSRLPSHLTLDGGNLVAAHGGLIEPMHNRLDGATRAFGLYGDSTGELDKDGFPIRRDWAADYRGRARVVYGHTVVTRLAWVNQTIDIDTGCVFGGYLTALRYPEMELVQQRAVRRHYHGKYVFD